MSSTAEYVAAAERAVAAGDTRVVMLLERVRHEVGPRGDLGDAPVWLVTDLHDALGLWLDVPEPPSSCPWHGARGPAVLARPEGDAHAYHCGCVLEWRGATG